jgi:hypothetical protein
MWFASGALSMVVASLLLRVYMSATAVKVQAIRDAHALASKALGESEQARQSALVASQTAARASADVQVVEQKIDALMVRSGLDPESFRR